MIICPNCKAELSDQVKFCTVCGTPVQAAEDIQAVNSAPAVAQPSTGQKNRKISPKVWAIGAGVVAVVAMLAVVIVVGLSIFGGGAKGKYVVYLKDGELQLNLLKGKDSIEITSKLVGDMNESYATAVASYASYLVKLSSDGKTVFYPDKFDSDAYCFDLYYRSTINAKAEAEKIASNVFGYKVSPDGKTIIYLNDKGLYEYNFKGSTQIGSSIMQSWTSEECKKIDSNIDMYWISEDCKSVVYTTNDGDLYLWKSGKDSDRLESNVNVQYVSQDLSTILFMKDDVLYVKKGTEDKEQIDENVYDIVNAYENGGVYYTKKDTTVTTLKDYVIDEYEKSDAEMVRPTYPSYYDYEWPEKPVRPYSWNYGTDEEYQQALAEYETASAAYQAAYDQVYAKYEADTQNYQTLLEEWYDKGSRDYYRGYLDSYEFNVSNIVLYYFDGNKSVEVVDNIAYDAYINGEYDFSDEEGTAAMLFYVAEREEVEKIRIEDIESLSSVRNQIREALEPAISLAAAREDESAVLVSGAKIVSVDADNAYYMTEIDENNEGILYRVSLYGKIEDPQEYDTEVYSGYVYTLESGKVVYYKDFDLDDFCGTLYIDGEKIEKDVTRVIETEDPKTLYLATDPDDGECTLYYYKDGKTTKIAKDVYESSIIITEEGGVLYLADYRTSKEEGKLYYFVNGKTAKEIDDDVAYIVAPNVWDNVRPQPR